MKYLIIILLITINLFGKNPYPDEHYYKLAKNYFENAKYQETIDTLLKIYDNHIANININFYLGRSFYELKKPEEATIYYERILITNQNHLRTRVELAQTYLMLGLDNDALKNFNMVLRNNIPNNVKQNIKKQILYIENKKKKHLFTGFIGLGLTYDTNVNNLTDTKAFNTPNFNNLTISDEQKKDKYALVFLNGNYYYKLSDRYTIENKVNLIGQYFDKEKQKDLSLLAYSLYFSQINKDNKLSYGFDISKVYLDDKSYLNILGATINYQRKVIDDIYSFLSLKFLKKDYSQDQHNNLNSDNYQLVLGNILPTNEYGNFTLMYLGSYEDAKYNTPDTTDKITNAILIENSYPYTTNLSLITTLDYSIIQERKNEPTFLIKRKDKLTNISYGVSYDISNKMNLSSTLKHSNNRSNIDIYSYDKNTIDIFLKRSF